MVWWISFHLKYPWRLKSKLSMISMRVRKKNNRLKVSFEAVTTCVCNQLP